MKVWVFRAIAVGVPLLFGVVLIGATLWVQGRLVYDAEAHRLRLQSGMIFVQEPGALLSGHRYLFDETLGWRNIPNWHAWTHFQPLTINSRGLRGPEAGYEKPDGVSRILVLGDSFTWGYGVGDDEVFPRRLEAQLGGAKKQWQVLNSGVSGWGTDQEYLFLKNEGFRYSPDIVVLAFFLGNDPANNVESKQYGLFKPVFRSVDLDLANVPVPPPGAATAQINFDGDPFALTMRIIARLAEECSLTHSRLVVMKFGMFLRPDGTRLATWDERTVAELPAPPAAYYLDLDRAFADQALTIEALAGGNANGHWNAFGHQRTADILHRFLVEHELL